LAMSETQKEKPTREGTTQTADIKGKILEYLFHLQKEGLRESTIEQKDQLLHRLLSLGADLNVPDTVKAAIANLQRSETYKLLLCIAYEGFGKYCGLPWTRPKYKQCEKLPFIPHETEIDALIAGVDRKTSALLRLLKETAMRLGEAWQLEWTHLDVQNHIATCNNPEKNSRPRIFNISPDLTLMLDKLPKVNQYIFGCGKGIQQGRADPKVHMKLLRRQKGRITRQRERVAAKLQNPRILKISYHTLRHWKATMLYHQTKDILYVMKFLGHKGLKNTLIYIDLEIACFPNGGDDYVGKVATTHIEALNLIEAGFEHVCVTPDGTMYFRKRR
jgi:integrase